MKISVLFCFASFLLVNVSCKNAKPKEEQESATNPKKPVTVIKEKWHWKNDQKQNTDAGYAQVVKVGNTIYISGIPTGDLTPKGIQKVYKELGQSLSAFGATPKNVVKETLYTTDIETMKKHNDARKEFYNGDYPAATWVQISRLYEPNCSLEVELIADLSIGTE